MNPVVENVVVKKDNDKLLQEVDICCFDNTEVIDAQKVQHHFSLQDEVRFF